MKVPIPSILLGLLSLSTYASAYLDHNELDARDSTNSLLVERNTVDVPFEPSLRSFLEGAAHAYQRALDDHDELLEARDEKIRIHFFAMLNGRALNMDGSFMEAYKSWNSHVMQMALAQQHPEYSLDKARCELFDGQRRSIPTLNSVLPNSMVVLQCRPWVHTH
ncbi:hypothetical protein DFP72DRAFT_896054 [Ephemerocybe angulata]|uniref:Uncharacterized protein n=1 Tax=Ephemerocybe angulata TaxID=980116 RepID=A0A8H6M795_9AGAR|nr:hypothetical protein DFP72DRAFT_896054 [Tulosesus angulatus]